jgi:hypothetical protein
MTFYQAVFVGFAIERVAATFSCLFAERILPG